MTVRSMVTAPTPIHVSPEVQPSTDSWECKHARMELAQSIAGVYVGFGTIVATSETGPGMAVGIAITGLAIGDTIVRSDAADHACRTGKYAEKA